MERRRCSFSCSSAALFCSLETMGRNYQSFCCGLSDCHSQPQCCPRRQLSGFHVENRLKEEVLKWKDAEIGEPKEGEVRTRNKAIGLNFINVYFQKVYKALSLPFTPVVVILFLWLEPRELEFLGLTDSEQNRSKVNLLITYYCMQGMTGYELLKKIKEEGKAPYLYVEVDFKEVTSKKTALIETSNQLRNKVGEAAVILR
ncbi:hypothetical protein HN51_036441, partial [Arachis hypogaea]